MSAGLFTLNCPQCTTELEVDPLGVGSCPECGHTYLSRFGHLIPVDRTTQWESPAILVEG